ncbi:class I adenylate-forming enzyme family protein [Streptomyces fildesensis]|uniref:class I adenylate-forming enzyme family protein n=1 Tax=Streptomyces fildesensis TaxID=375757 RepID=UPI0027B9C20F|nr:class I adenylate-forming enzyme family protein [Streptomyces fildesensis]
MAIRAITTFMKSEMPEASWSTANFLKAHTYMGVPWSHALVPRPSLIERLAHQAEVRRDAPAITVLHPALNDDSCSYAQLWARVLDRQLDLARSGIGAADVCGIQVSNSIESVVSILSVIAAGAVALLVDANEPEGRSNAMIASAATVDLRPGYDRRRIRPPGTTQGLAAMHHPAVMVFTTGSTAASKAVTQAHYSIVLNALAVARHHRMTHSDVLACPLPISHVNGLEFGLFATLLRGGHCLLYGEFDPFHFIDTLHRHAATLATTVPPLLRALSSIREWPNLERLRYFVSAASPLPSEVLEGVHERGKCVVQGYGLSETMNFSTVMPYKVHAGVLHGCELSATSPYIPSAGSAIFGNEIAVRGDGSPTPAGEVGEVVIRGHSVMSGYANNPTATENAFADGWFHTGDLGLIVPSSEYPGHSLLYITGRIKNVVKCAGVSISLDELDRAVLEISGVDDACAASRPDVHRGEAVTIFYVTKLDNELDQQLIRGACARVASPSLLGLRIVRLRAIPRLRSGKPNRRQLASQAAQMQ